MKALVLLSGGQDSTTCLYWAKTLFEEVEAIGFDYGQSHKVELEQAKKIAADIGVPYIVKDVTGLLAKSSLTEYTNHNEKSYVNESLPASFTAGRNLLFLTIAGAYAAENNIQDIITGVCQTDYSGYPDCRRNTIDALQLALSLGLGTGDMRLHTPLMYMSKAATWRLAKELNCLDVIVNDTVTDYDGDMTKNEWGYGKEDNPSSKLRAQGYREAKEKNWI